MRARDLLRVSISFTFGKYLTHFRFIIEGTSLIYFLLHKLFAITIIIEKASRYIFISFVLLGDYFNSLNFYKNGELSRNQIGRSGVQVKKENEKFTVVRSRPPQNLKCGHFTLFFSRGRQRNVLKCKRTYRAIVFAR